MSRTPPTTLDRSRALRADGTDAEKTLWRLLRGRRVDGWKFRRQHPVPPYVLDFACIDAQLAVEADGDQHNGAERDELRAEFLTNTGWRVLRFWNTDILANPDGVAETILGALSGKPSPHPPTAGRWVPPSPAGGGRGDLEA